MLIENGIVNAAGKPKFSFHALRHASITMDVYDTCLKIRKTMLTCLKR